MDTNVHALLFADRIITEDNGKKGLIGVFTQFNFPQFPAQAAPWSVYVSMDNVSAGEHEFTINIVRESSKQVVFSASGSFEHEVGQSGVELALPIPPIQFPGDGRYVVTISLNGRDIAYRNLRVELLLSKGDQS